MYVSLEHLRLFMIEQATQNGESRTARELSNLTRDQFELWWRSLSERDRELNLFAYNGG